MSEFTPITSQEEFDKAIQKRLAQQEKQINEQFKDYLSPDDAKALRAELDGKVKEANEAVKVAEEKLKAKDQTVAEITKRAEVAEGKLLKNRIAYESKLPVELADRLVGSTEDELKADAASLSALLKPQTAPPLYSGTAGGSNSNTLDAGMTQLLGQLNAGLQK